MRRHAPIVFILAIAALARYWAIDFCLPSTLCRPDEEAVVAVATSFFNRHYNPHFFDWPSLFMYEVALGMVPLFKIGRWIGWYRSEAHYLQMMVLDPTAVYLTARVLSAAAGTASVWVLYRIARRLYGETTALVAALFLALAFLHVRDSHFGVTDITATFLVLVSFLFVIRYWLLGSGREWLAAAFTAGLATSTKYNAALIALPLLWVVITRRDARPLATRIGQAALVPAVMFLAFFMTSPFAVISYPELMKSLGEISSHLSQGHGVNLGRGWIVHLSSSLRYGLGIPLLAAGIIGLLLGILGKPSTFAQCASADKKGLRPRDGVMVAIFPITYYLVIGSGYTTFARYILPVVPFLALGAALIVSQVKRPALMWAIALIIIAPSAWSVFQFDRLLARTDSRVLAENWVMEHYPNGALIGEIGRGSTKLHFVPPQPGVPSPYKSLAVDEDPGEPDILVVPISLFDPTAQVSAPAMLLKQRYLPAHTVRAQDLAATGVVFDWQDEFYLPLTGFAAIERPGPNYEIYVRPDP
ncbi:MAG: glycosyltransferase family 39 protein [Vicinamibacterales bacterium]